MGDHPRLLNPVPSMRFRQIEVFHAVYTTGSISAAARALHVSQPSVSKVLQHTQQQLGLQALSIANQAPQSIMSLFRN